MDGFYSQNKYGTCELDLNWKIETTSIGKVNLFFNQVIATFIDRNAINTGCIHKIRMFFGISNFSPDFIH